MKQFIKPLQIALKGKGVGTFLKRVWTIGSRYGLTAAKMDRSLEQLSAILQQFGGRATLPVTAAALARNGRTIQKYQNQGIEFAVHGLVHVDYSQLDLAEQTRHFSRAGQIFRQQGIAGAGFRAPYLRTNRHTLPALRQTGFEYDTSPSLHWPVAASAATESYARALDFYGAQPAADYPSLPYFDAETGLVRLPYALPDDESLVERLAWPSPEAMNQVWPEMFQSIHRQGELFNLGLHPERMAECAPALAATLQSAYDAVHPVWRASLGEISRWWKARFAAEITVSRPEKNTFKLEVNGPEGTALLLRALNAGTATKPAFNRYAEAAQMPCLILSDRRPFIGVSPDSAPALVVFLTQQGYIVETSTDVEAYPFYLRRSAFTRAEERPLLEQIETADFPLARLGRWPNGARSALCITGDIDALTLWDYGVRFLGK